MWEFSHLCCNRSVVVNLRMKPRCLFKIRFYEFASSRHPWIMIG